MALPLLVTIEDIDDLVAYLKTKPAGSSVTDAKKVIRKQIFDNRKMPAYTAWQIIKRDADNLKLDERGWHLARNSRPRHVIFQEIIKSNPAYTSALDWAFHNGLDEITSIDVGSHWHEHHSEALGTSDEKGIKDRVGCFFRICEAANLGKLTIGRRGQTTRFSLSKDRLELFIGTGIVPEESPDDEIDDFAEDKTLDQKEIEAGVEEEDDTDDPGIGGKESASKYDENEQVRVFISHGKNMELVEQVETMLGVAEIPYELAVSEETSAIPVPEKVFNSMRKCNSAVIIVSVDKEPEEDETPTINQNVLIEIGAAFVLYNKRVILLWDKRIPVPSNLQGLYRSEFEGDELSWKSGMKLMKALKDFQNA
jgi:CAP12/Pycsar effector protein, TIR domain